MRTKTIKLFYQLTQHDIIPPAATELERKERWIKELQKTVEADYKPLMIKLTYELHNPEVEKQSRFFNGTCVKYYAIQDMDLNDGRPDSKSLKMYRELILDEMLGFDLQLVDRVVRRRKSTSDFQSVQDWNKFLNTLEETLFDSAGYEFPDSKSFWAMVDMLGYEEAERISIENLQKSLKKKQSHG